jgi:hypothetical protein
VLLGAYHEVGIPVIFGEQLGIVIALQLLSLDPLLFHVLVFHLLLVHLLHLKLLVNFLQLCDSQLGIAKISKNIIAVPALRVEDFFNSLELFLCSGSGKTACGGECHGPFCNFHCLLDV